MEELLSLKWNNHRSTFLHILGVLRDKQSYTDVTLACDGKFYSVHKLVLSTCSDYFCAMFEKTACKSPVIVLKDIKSEDLEALLDYMYLGEVNVRQSDLASLIKAAENLRIKGLAVPDDEPSKKSVVGAPSRREGSPPAKRKRRDESDDGRDDIRPLPSSLPNHPPSRPRSPVIERLSPSPHRTSQDPSLVEDHGRPHSSPAEPSVSSHSSSQPSQSQPGGGNQFQSEDVPFVKVEMEDDDPEPDGTEYTVNSDGYKEEDGDSGGGVNNDLPEFLQAAASGTLSSSTSSYSHPSFAGPSSYQPGDMAGWQGDVSNLGFPSHLNFSTSDTSSQQNAPGVSLGSGIGDDGKGRCDAIVDVQGVGGVRGVGRGVGEGISGVSTTMEWHQPQQQEQLQHLLSPQEQQGLQRKGDGLPPPPPHQQHIDLHQFFTKERQYTCKFCGKWFATPSKVVRHERTHTGERPYVCSLCPLSFNQREILKRHLRSVHKISNLGEDQFCLS